MARNKENPAPAGRPGTGRVEIELGSHFLDLSHIIIDADREGFAIAWLARRGVRPALANTVADLAGIGGAP